MMAMMVLWSLLLLLVVGSSHGEVAVKLSTKQDLAGYLQREQVACSQAQQSILQQLRSRRIPIGQEPSSLRSHEHDDDWSIEKRVIESREDNAVDCRVTLDRAVLGSKCIAPCGCTGSSKWVQFSVLNKLRRKDPNQWVTCQTCRQPFNYELFTSFGGVRGAVLGYVLDHPTILRSGLVTVFLIAALFTNAQSWFTRFIVSKTFWQKYPLWSTITRLPFALKIWLYKIVFVYIIERYLKLEKDYLVNFLADLETSIIEEALPVPSSPADANNGEDGEEEADEQEEEEA